MAANDCWGDHHYDNFVNHLKCSRQKVKWNDEKKRLKFLDQLYESMQNCPGRRRVNLRDIFRKEDIGCLLWDCIKQSGKRFVYLSARSGFSDSEVNALLARTKPPADAARREDTSIRRTIVKSTARIISAPFDIRNRFNRGANHSSSHSANHGATSTGVTDFHPASGNSGRQDDVAENSRENSRAWTPLQWAVLNLLPDRMNMLMTCDADLASFVFPTADEFIESLRSYNSREAASKLILASGLLVVIERLESRGYAMQRDDALTIMKLFERYELFERKKPATLGLSSYWHSDTTFVEKAKRMKIRGDLSLDDLIRLRPEQADERGVACSDYFEFAKSKKLLQLPRDSQRGCAARLCETMARGFFRRWALNAYLVRTDNWLPIDFCKAYIHDFRNESLYHYARHESLFDDPIFLHYLPSFVLIALSIYLVYCYIYTVIFK